MTDSESPQKPREPLKETPSLAPPRNLLPAPTGWLRPLAQAPATAKKLVRIISSTPPLVGIASQGVLSRPVLWSYIGMVLAPAFATALYFAFIASNQYVVESKFAVRTIEADQHPDIGGGAAPSSSGAGNAVPSPATATSFSFTATGQNAYIVTSYIRSRAIVDDILPKVDLREIFRRPEADYWARLKRDSSIDELTEYWLSMVDTYVDSLSQVVTVKLRAFRREDALVLAEAIIQASEELINRISDRARNDATAMAEKEVRQSFVAVQSALNDLHSFRDAAGMIDPGQATNEIEKLLLPLMGEKIKIEADLFVAAQEMSEDAPTVRLLREKLSVTESHIKQYKARLTSETKASNTVSQSLAKFEELEIQRLLAERFYALAQAELDRAQLRANRQNVYLNVFVPPALPEESLYPRRLAFSLLAFIGLTIVWAILAMLVASVQDHRL